MGLLHSLFFLFSISRKRGGEVSDFSSASSFDIVATRQNDKLLQFSYLWPNLQASPPKVQNFLVNSLCLISIYTPLVAIHEVMIKKIDDTIKDLDLLKPCNLLIFGDEILKTTGSHNPLNHSLTDEWKKLMNFDLTRDLPRGTSV